MTTTDPWALAADQVDPPPAPHVFELLGYRPHPGPQAEFHQIRPFADGGPWDVLFGGAMGGGKTEALLHDALAKAHRYPGIEVWFVRETYTDITRDIVPRLERMGFAAAIGGRWNGGNYTLRLPNGSRVRFLHAPNTAAAASIRGECQYLIVDESTLIDPEALDILALRVRSGDARIPVIGIRRGSNPGGIGHGRTKEAFYDPAPLGRTPIPIVDVETGLPVTTDTGRVLERWFLPSLAKDNPSLDSSYTTRFQLMTDDVRAAFRDGDWSRFAGMRFPKIGRCIVEAGQLGDLPLGGVRRGLGIDWGMAAPFAGGWGLVLNEQVIVYRELHEAGLSVTEQAALVLASEMPGERLPQRPIPTWLDPACWTRDPQKPMSKPIDADAPPPGSIAATFRAAGVPVEKAYNDRISGWTLIDELLGDLPDGRRRMLISDACPNIIRSLSNAPRSKRNPEDVDENYGDDHAADAARYLLTGLMRRSIVTTRRGSGGSGARGATSAVARAGT